MLAWVSDLHLELAGPEAIDRWTGAWNASAARAVVCTGDVAEGALLLPTLRRIDAALTKPFYFVLGNHDFYDGDLDRVRGEVADLACESRFLRYLTAEENPIELGRGLALVGDDSWADGRVGDLLASDVTMRDYERIPALTGIEPSIRAATLARLGADAADRLRGKLAAALARSRKTIVATHVPPFREACRYHGRIADDAWAPHFVCGSLGEVLLDAAGRFPDRLIETLCGHCHHFGVHRPLPNLAVFASGSCYRDVGTLRLIAT